MGHNIVYGGAGSWSVVCRSKSKMVKIYMNFVNGTFSISSGSYDGTSLTRFMIEYAAQKPVKIFMIKTQL